jgi:Flp pilus assembly protein TadG
VRRGERGSALVEFTWLAILLLVPTMYIVLAVFEVQRAAFGVSSAARAAGRALTVAPGEAEALRHAQVAADVTLRDQDVDPRDRTVRVRCEPDPRNCLAPGAVVHVEVVAAVALPFVPAFLGEHRPSVRVSAEHSVPYGSFREDRS